MAFLCPSRMGGKERKKKKEHAHLFGRITGSDSVDTLVRVGLEKQHGLGPDSRKVVSHSFTACIDRELSVTQGQDIYVLYEDNGWAYVLTEDNKEGFVPVNHLRPWTNANRRSVSPPTQLEVAEDLGLEDTGDVSTDLFSISGSESSSSTTSRGSSSVHAFKKQSYGRYVVVFDFLGGDEDDVALERCELVTVLNMEDPDWYWVLRSTGEEGFAPRTYLCPYPSDLDLSGTLPGDIPKRENADTIQRRRDRNVSDVKELVTITDYVRQCGTELELKCGDILLVDMANQKKSDWLWAYSPGSDSYGYVPEVNVKFTQDNEDPSVALV